MEGGDNPEQLTKTEESKPETSIQDESIEAPSSELTDSLLDDDLVVIPSQNEQIEDEIQDAGPEEAETVPPVSSPPVEPEPTASEPASESPQESSSSSEVPPPVIPPPQPNPILEPAPAPVATPAPAPVATPVPAQAPVATPAPAPIASPAPAPETTRRPVMATKPRKAIEEDDDEDFEDESLIERLTALSEMFPERLRSATYSACGLSLSGLKGLFNFSRSALWIGSTSFLVLILPIVFETEMVHMEQANIQRQKQILLGPNAATAGAMPGAMTPAIPGVSVAAAPDSR